MVGEAEPAWPKTLEQAVDRLLADLEDTDRDAIRAMAQGDLIQLHISLGAHIRNAFGLWRGNTALLAACGGGHGLFIHPDDASGIIIESLWRRLQSPA